MSAAEDMRAGLVADRATGLFATAESRARFRTYLDAAESAGLAGMDDFITWSRTRLAEYDTDPSSLDHLPRVAEATTGGDTR